MNNNTFIVGVVFAFLLGLLLKVNTDHQIVNNQKQLEVQVAKEINQKEKCSNKPFIVVKL